MAAGRESNMDIRKIDALTEYSHLKKGQKVKLRVDFYDSADFDEHRKPMHRKGDVGVIDGFGVLCGQEVVAVEICHHGRGTFEVVPLSPSDIENTSPETPVTQPDRPKDDGDAPLAGQDSDRPVVIFDIKKID